MFHRYSVCYDIFNDGKYSGLTDEEIDEDTYPFTVDDNEPMEFVLHVEEGHLYLAEAFIYRRTPYTPNMMESIEQELNYMMKTSLDDIIQDLISVRMAASVKYNG